MNILKIKKKKHVKNIGRAAKQTNLRQQTTTTKPQQIKTKQQTYFNAKRLYFYTLKKIRNIKYKYILLLLTNSKKTYKNPFLFFSSKLSNDE